MRTAVSSGFLPEKSGHPSSPAHKPLAPIAAKFLVALRPWRDAQAQMRHSRSSTTLDIYQQFVAESQQRAVDRLSRLVN